MIAVLALFLSFSETLGKGAQTEAISENIAASNLWNFFQAKTIRKTMLRTEAETDDHGRRGHGPRHQGGHGEADRDLAEDCRRATIRSRRPMKAARSYQRAQETEEARHESREV